MWLHNSILPFRFSRVWWKLSTIAIGTIYHLQFQSSDRFGLSCRYECIFERSIDCRYKRRRLFKMQTVVQGKYPPWGVFGVSTHCNKICWTNASPGKTNYSGAWEECINWSQNNMKGVVDLGPSFAVRITNYQLLYELISGYQCSRTPRKHRWQNLARRRWQTKLGQGARQEGNKLQIWSTMREPEPD